MRLTRFLRFLWVLFAIAVTGVAVAVSAARLILPEMSHYRAELEVLAERFVQRKVEIGSIDAAWHGVLPVLRLENVLVETPDLPAGELRLGQVEVALDLWDSLLSLDWKTAGFRLLGVELALNTDLQEPLAEFHISGPLAWLMQQQSVELADIRMAWSDPSFPGGLLVFEQLHAQLKNEADRHQLLLRGSLQPGEETVFLLGADLSGELDRPLEWQGQLYLKAGSVDLQMLPALYKPVVSDVEGMAALEFWAGLGPGSLEWVSGHLTLDELSLIGRDAMAPAYQADRLETRVQWAREGTEQLLSFSDFSIERDSAEVWPQTDVHLKINHTEETRVEGDVSIVSLDELRALSPVVPFGHQEQANLERLHPTGLLKDLVFGFGIRDGVLTRLAGRARFDNLGFQPDASKPGVSGLSGRVEGDLESGFLRLDSRRAGLNLPEVFSRPVQVDYLNGVVSWQKFEDRLRLFSRQLMLDVNDVGLVARWQMDWPYGDESPLMDLQVAATPMQMSKVSELLPDKALQPRTLAWLQRAFRAGEAHNVRFLLQGRMDQLPFDHGEGRLEARFDFDGVRLDYHPEWGQLDALQGYAAFSGRSMEITGTSALIQGLPVERAVVRIADFGKPVLDIRGTVSGTLAGMLDYVDSTPLGERYGTLLDRVDALEDARLQLAIRLPLVHGLGSLDVSGAVQMQGNELLLKGRDEGLTHIQGTLNFSHDGITAKNLRARLLGQPVTVSVYRQEDEQGVHTLVDAEGGLGLVKLLQDIGSEYASLLEGAANWHALLKVPSVYQPGQAPYELQLRSTLQGVAIALPGPFGKTAAEQRELLIEWVPEQENRYPVFIRYADLASARVLLNEQRTAVDRAGVFLGRRPAVLPGSAVIRVDGHVGTLDVAQWVAMADTGSGVGPATTLPAIVFDIGVDHLELHNSRVSDLRVRNSAADPAGLLVSGSGAAGKLNWITGSASIPSALHVRLDRLAVESKGGESVPVEVPGADPRHLPGLDIRIDRLVWGEMELGVFELVADTTDVGLEASRIALTSEAIVFEGIAGWYVRGAGQSSTLDIRITDGDLGTLFQQFGNSDAVHGGRLSGSVEVDWPGSPGAFRIDALEGELDLKAEKGSIEALEEGAGKLLHLVSLNSLQRRLSLDFSDLFKGGFSFDEMSGSFVLMGGNAFTDSFVIRGNSAVISVSGRTGLVERDYDQLVEVTPELSSSLPVVGAIAGGPVVGAGVLLAERLFGSEFNKMGRVYYRVTGSWDQPVYERVKAEPSPGQNSEDDTGE